MGSSPDGVSLRRCLRARVIGRNLAVWRAWCGQRVDVEAVVIAKVVTYHLLFYERRRW